MTTLSGDLNEYWIDAIVLKAQSAENLREVVSLMDIFDRITVGDNGSDNQLFKTVWYNQWTQSFDYHAILMPFSLSSARTNASGERVERERRRARGLISTVAN